MSKREISDGARHARITVLLMPLAGLLVALTPLPVHPALRLLLGMAGCYSGLFLSPDLDQEMLTDSEWRVLKIPVAGWLLGTIWAAFWLPYALATSHRRRSHWPIFGTLTRVGYLAIPLLIWAAWAGEWGWWAYWAYALCAVEGLAVADLGHYARDFHGLEV